MDSFAAKTDKNNDETFMRSVASPLAGPDENRASVVNTSALEWAGRRHPFLRKVAHQWLWS